MALASFTSGGLFGLSEGTATGSHFSPHLADNRSPATHSASSPEADHLLRSPPQSQPDRASAAPSWAAFPPRKATTPYVAGEAPMGITDFGQTSGGTVSYNTSSFEGSAAIHSLVVCASSSPCGSTQLGFQLNTVLGFEDGGNWYVYWIQDVMVVDTGSKSVIAFEDNIWNLSGYGTTMYSSTVSGYGAVQSGGYYADGVAIPSALYVYPGTYDLILNTSVNAADQPVVQVMFDTGHGFSTYDVVTFVFVSRPAFSDDFIVDGGTSNPVGLAYDAEWILGGPGGGLNTIDESSDLQLGLQYWNGNNYETVNDAENYAENTAETISDAAVVGAYYDSDGSLFAQVSAGTETTSTLWYSSDIALVELQGPSSCNGSLIAGTGSNPYLSGNATIAIGAASLDFQDACDGYTLDFGDYSLAQGSTTVLDAGTWADVSFSETGLPSGLAWGVSIGSDKKSGDGAALSFYLPVGSYSFTLSGGVGYLPTPSATSLSFGGSGEDVSIVWELVDVSSTAGSDSIDVSQPVTFSVTLTSGSAGDSFAWTGLPGGCSASDSATVTCSPTSPSNQSIVVKVTDSDGFVASSLPFSFQVYADPTLTTPTGSPSSIDIGQTVTFTSIASNGSGGNTFAWTGLPTGCHPVSGPTLSCTPTAVATVSITISVTDSNGYTATSSTLSFTVYSMPSVTLSVTPSSVLQSSTVTFTTTVFGGAGGLTYLWNGLPPGCTAPTGANLTCSPSSSGTYDVTVNVTDQNGGRDSSSANLTINAAFLGLPALEGYGVLALVIALVALLVIILATRRRTKRDDHENPSVAARIQQYSPRARPSPAFDITAPPSGVWEDHPPDAGALCSEQGANPSFDVTDPGSEPAYWHTPLLNPPETVCWHCQYENPPASLYCAKCGLPLEPPPPTG
ncbi:MAG: thermopsin family protease [Thermoplasmata archaeon]